MEQLTVINQPQKENIFDFLSYIESGFYYICMKVDERPFDVKKLYKVRGKENRRGQ